jgi:hypothetical protein
VEATREKVGGGGGTVAVGTGVGTDVFVGLGVGVEALATWVVGVGSGVGVSGKKQFAWYQSRSSWERASSLMASQSARLVGVGVGVCVKTVREGARP